MSGRSERLPRNAEGSRHESDAAARRLRPSDRSFSPGIRTSRGYVWAWWTGRTSCGFCRRRTAWPLFRHRRPTFAPWVPVRCVWQRRQLPRLFAQSRGQKHRVAEARMGRTRLSSNQARRLRAHFARNAVRHGRIPKRTRTRMFLIDSHGKRPVCIACHRLGPYQEAEPGVFICEACVQAADAHLLRLAESIPELRDHRLKRWREGCDCDRCRQRGTRAAV